MEGGTTLLQSVEIREVLSGSDRVQTLYSVLHIYGNPDRAAVSLFFFLNDAAPPEISPLPLHDALPIYLLQSIFLPLSPLHDGAVIVQDDRVAAAACFLPLTVNPKLSKDLGSRHRAAIGLTEENDSRSEEHTSELQSLAYLVCRLLLEKK